MKKPDNLKGVLKILSESMDRVVDFYLKVDKFADIEREEIKNFISYMDTRLWALNDKVEKEEQDAKVKDN